MVECPFYGQQAISGTRARKQLESANIESGAILLLLKNLRAILTIVVHNKIFLISLGATNVMAANLGHLIA